MCGVRCVCVCVEGGRDWNAIEGERGEREVAKEEDRGREKRKEGRQKGVFISYAVFGLCFSLVDSIQ